MTPLQLACFKGRAKVIKVLADFGDVNEECWTEVAKLVGTPLHIAAFYGHAATCQALIDGGHRVDARNFRGRTPVWSAATNGHAAALKVLVEAKACIAAASLCAHNKTQTPLYIAAQRGFLDVVHVLVTNGDTQIFQFPYEADDETGYAGCKNECGEFIRKIRDHGGWPAYCERIQRDRPKPGVETHRVPTNKLSLPKDFKNMG